MQTGWSDAGAAIYSQKQERSRSARPAEAKLSSAPRGAQRSKPCFGRSFCAWLYSSLYHLDIHVEIGSYLSIDPLKRLPPLCASEHINSVLHLPDQLPPFTRLRKSLPFDLGSAERSIPGMLPSKRSTAA